VARTETRRLGRFGYGGDDEEQGEQDVVEFCFILLFPFGSVLDVWIQELWDIAQCAGESVRGAGQG
jgi:hypothetical protein